MTDSVFVLPGRSAPCSFEIVFSIDAERNPVHAPDRNRHSGFERAKLLELLSQLEG